MQQTSIEHLVRYKKRCLIECDAVKSGTNSPSFRRNVGKLVPNYTLSRPRRQCFHRYRHENLRYLSCQRNL